METGKLTKDSPISPNFTFLGDCHICLKGSGAVTIERELGGNFVPITTELGQTLTFIGDGVLFNSKISGSLRHRVKHRLVSETSSQIEYIIFAEKP